MRKKLLEMEKPVQHDEKVNENGEVNNEVSFFFILGFCKSYFNML